MHQQEAFRGKWHPQKLSFGDHGVGTTVRPDKAIPTSDPLDVQGLVDIDALRRTLASMEWSRIDETGPR